MNIYDAIGLSIFFTVLALFIYVAIWYMRKWDFGVAIDDGTTLKIIHAEGLGTFIVKDDKGNEVRVIRLKYKYNGNEYIRDIPYTPEMFRIIPLRLGLKPTMVVRIDKTGAPLGWETHIPDTVVKSYEKSLIANTTLNVLKRKIRAEKYMLYIMIIILVFAVLIPVSMWIVTSHQPPVIINIPNTTSTQTPAKIPLPR
jgi:hypothetical protein